MSDAGVRGLTLALLAAVAVYSFARFEVTNSITHFFPSGGEAELVELSLELVDSRLSRRMVLTVGQGSERFRAAAALADRLRSHPEVEWIEAGLHDDALRGFYDVYFDRAIYLTSDTPEVEIPKLFEPSALEQRARELRASLAGPTSILVARAAPADPLGLFERVLERTRDAQALPTAGDGVFASADGAYAIILVGLRSSPFESERQAGLLRDIEAEFAEIAAASGGDLELGMSGVNRIAVATEQTVRSDLNFISAVSVAAVCALFLLVFRSLRHLAIAVLAPVAGFAAAIAVALSFGGPVHSITLGFGFVLIGVAIDYPIHVMNHHALAPVAGSPRETVGRIRGSLLLSGLTTTLAFAALALSDFPGLGEMGTFAAVGVPVALGVAMFSVPAFLRSTPDPTRVQRALSVGAVGLIRWLEARVAVAVALVLALMVIAAAGLPRLHWEDDPGSLTMADPALLEEDERVRRRMAYVDGGRFVVALASEAEAALALNDEIYQRLAAAVAAGHLDGVHSLHSFLWSQSLQRANLAAFSAVPQLTEKIDRAFSAVGFRPGAFGRFAEAVAQPTVAPLSPRDLVESPLARVLDSLVELDERVAAVTYLRGVRSSEGVEAALDGLPGAQYVDQRSVIAAVYQGYRRSTTRMVALGCAIVFCVLQLRYRSVTRGLLAFLPSALVALATFGLFGLLGIAVNVVSAISLLVVLGMGVDYGIFTVDCSRDFERLGPTMSSLLVSCLTTLFVFGALALSAQPVLRSIGMTTGVGILFALALSPAVSVLARRIRA